MSEVKIFKIEKKGKHYLVYASENELPIKLTEDCIVNNRIMKGVVFDEETWKEIVSSSNNDYLFDKVLNFIDYKPRTEKEIREYLIKKEVSEYVMEDIIKRLKQIKYLDDDKYASAFVEEGIKNKKGPLLISYQLDNLGIEKDITSKYLSNYDYETQFANALEIAKKSKALQSRYPIKKSKELIYQKLIRTGYNVEIINKALASLDFQADSLENLWNDYQRLLTKSQDKNKIITALMAKGYNYQDIKKVINNE